MLSSNADYEEAKIQNNRMLTLIPEVTKQRSEFAIAVAEIKISFNIPKEINELIVNNYKAQSLIIKSVVDSFATVEELEQWKDSTNEVIINHLKTEYFIKIEKIIEYLYPEYENL